MVNGRRLTYSRNGALHRRSNLWICPGSVSSSATLLRISSVLALGLGGLGQMVCTFSLSHTASRLGFSFLWTLVCPDPLRSGGSEEFPLDPEFPIGPSCWGNSRAREGCAIQLRSSSQQGRLFKIYHALSYGCRLSQCSNTLAAFRKVVNLSGPRLRSG